MKESPDSKQAEPNDEKFGALMKLFETKVAESTPIPTNNSDLIKEVVIRQESLSNDNPIQFINDYNERIKNVADSYSTQFFQKSPQIKRAQSTIHGEIFYIDAEHRIRLAGTGEVILDDAYIDFFILTKWDEKGDIEDLLDDNGNESLRDNQGNSQPQPATVRKTNSEVNLQNEEDQTRFSINYDDFTQEINQGGGYLDQLCSCLSPTNNFHPKTHILRTFKSTLFSKTSSRGLDVTLNNQPINQEPITSNRLSQTGIDNKSLFDKEMEKEDFENNILCFKHELLVAWTDSAITIKNLFHDNTHSIEIADFGIKFVQKAHYPHFIIFGENNREIILMNIQNYRYKVIKSLSPAIFRNFDPTGFYYILERQTLLLYDSMTFLMLGKTSKEKMNRTTAKSITHVKSLDSLIYYDENKIKKYDMAHKASETLKTMSEPISCIFVSGDERSVYACVPAKFSFNQSLKFSVIAQIEIESSRTINKILLPFSQVNGFFVDYNHSVLIVETPDGTFNYRLKNFTYETIGIFDGLINAISDDGRYLYTQTEENEFYRFDLTGEHPPKLFYKDVGWSSNIFESEGRIFFSIDSDDKEMMYEVDDQGRIITNISEKISVNVKQEFIAKKLQILNSKAPLKETNQAETQSQSLHEPNNDIIPTRPDELSFLVLEYGGDESKKLHVFTNFNTTDIWIADSNFENIRIIKTNFDYNVFYAKFISDSDHMLFLAAHGALSYWNVSTGTFLKQIASGIINFAVDTQRSRIYCLTYKGHLCIYEAIELRCVYECPLINFDEILADTTNTIMRLTYDKKHLLIGHQSTLYRVDLRNTVTILEKSFISMMYNSKGNTSKDTEFNELFGQFKIIYRHSMSLGLYFNPFFVAACHMITSGFDSLFQSDFLSYPYSSHQLSPIILACYTGNFFLLDTICTFLIKQPIIPLLTQNEIIFLLKVDSVKAKHLLIKIFMKIERIYYYEYLTGNDILRVNLVGQKNRFFNKSTARAFFGETLQPNANESSNGYSINSKFFEKPEGLNAEPSSNLELFENKMGQQVEFYLIRGEYNFDIGSEASLNFLESYMNCELDEFTMSDWRHIVKLKWQKLRYFYWLQSIVFIAQSILVTALFFFPDNFGLFAAIEILLFLTLFYEVLSIAFYSRKYFTTIQNNVDFFGNISAIVLTFTLYMNPENRNEETRAFRFFYVLLLAVMYLRSLLYLRAFKQLRHLIAMLFAITLNVFDIIFLFAFILICLGFLLTISNEESAFQISLYNTFVAMHGNFSDENTKDFKDWILLVLISIFVSLIMANFMIARISNNYNALENSQYAVNYRELASIIWELEIWHKILSSLRRASKQSTGQSLFYFIGIYSKDVNNQNTETVNKHFFETSLKQMAKEVKKKFISNSNCQGKILEQITNHFDKSQRILNDLSNQKRTEISRRLISPG